MWIRFAWGVMLVSHAGWLVGSFGATGTSSLARLALVLAVVFFALKTYDVAALRFRRDRRSLIAAALVILLLHAGAINRLLDVDESTALWWIPAMAAPLSLARMRLSIFSRLAQSLAIFFARRQAALIHVYWEIVAEVRHRWLRRFVLTVRTPRAPPA